jgi:glutamine synthetase
MAKNSRKSRPRDCQRIRILFPDHLGLARGKYLPAAHRATHANHCVGIFALTFDRTMIPAPGSKMLEGLPDCKATFSLDDIRPGWEPDTGVIIADLEVDGEPLAISPRHTLRRAIADWAALGYRVNIGIELEAYIMEPDGSGGWKPWDTPGAYVYGTGTAVDPIGLFQEIMQTAERCGLPVESINSEYDTPQWELTLVFGEALQAVDNIFLFKVMAREVAARHGLLLTYLGRPFSDRSGSGMHVNVSLVDKKGKNALADATTKDGLSKLAHHCVAGLIAHHEGMSALCAPTVNAYKRLRAGQLAGYWANWGYDHRGATLRVPRERGAATRLEHRMPDGSASPYLASAAVLQAARLGFVNRLDAPAPEEQDCLEHQSTGRHVPDDLGRALEAFEADIELFDAVGHEMSACFVAIKQAEWQKFRVAVTDWELNHYLPFL